MDLKGLEEVASNLNKALNTIKGKTLKGLMKSANLIESKSNEKAPIDQGNLVGTSYAVQTSILSAEVGYTAEYAAAVHEMPMKLKGQPRKDFGKTRAGKLFGGGSGNGTYWEVGENKYLEKAVKENTDKIVKIILQEAKVE